MLRARLILLGVLAVLVGSAGATPPAFADEYVVEGKGLTAEEKLEGTSGESTFEVVSGPRIACKKGTVAGSIESGGASKGKLVFKECAVTNAESTCEVSEPIELKFKDQLVNEPVEDELKPEAGESFGELTIKSKVGKTCAFAVSKGKVTGTQTCELPKSEEELAEHEIVCKPAGSKLKFAGKEAKLNTAEKVKLVSGKHFDDIPTPKFQAEGGYPFNFEGKVTANLVFNFKNNNLENVPECSAAKFVGTLAAASTTLVTTPTFETCAMASEATTVTPANCSVQWLVTRLTGPRKYAGELVLANSGAECKITIVAKGVETGCQFIVKGQGFASGMEYERIEGTPKQVEARFTLTGVVFSTNGNAACKNLGATGEISGRVKFDKMLVQ